MKKKYSDDEIIEGLRFSDENIIQHLYSRYEEDVINFVMRNSGTKKEAEDVIQESFMRIYTHIINDKLNLTTSFNAYFTTVYQNVWINFVRQKKRERIFLEEIISENPITEEQYVEFEPDISLLHDIIWECFEKLGTDCQELLEMHYLEKKPMTEIAYLMNYKNEQIARNKRFKCLGYLKQLIKNDKKYKLIHYE